MNDRPARTLHLPHAGGRAHAAPGHHIVVAGGGIAGLAAATVLTERGVRVTLVEREAFLGGRAGAWPDTLSTGEPFEMERGFHAFFRQYYNLRSLLRRIDPHLSFLRPLDDYPILGPRGQVQSFHGLPRRTPWNVAALTARTPTLGWRDLAGVDKKRALEMLTYHPERTYSRRDAMSAGDYLDSLDFPADARRLLFDVFAHSFFNPEGEMSAAELLMMFHFYFTGNPEGLVFDVVDAPFGRALWNPLGDYLRGGGAEISLGETLHSVAPAADGRWRVATDQRVLEADGVVLALTVPGLQKVVDSSEALDDHRWRERVGRLALTRPFAVWRLWLDCPTESGRAPFVGTTGLGRIDNISLYHLFEDESRDWAQRTGGSVIELHAYAIEEDCDEGELKAELLDALHQLVPETREASILEERWLVRQDCPAFARGSFESRPTVDTPFEGLTLAGDFVKLTIPSALMERATASGILAANHLLARIGVRGEPIHSIRAKGLLASFAKA